MTANVGDFKTVLGFGWKYMRPYWTRLVCGIVLGCLCGLTASTFIWATRTLAERLQKPTLGARDTSPDVADPAEDAAKVRPHKPRVVLFPGLGARLKEGKQATSEIIEPWLPRT